MKILYTTQATIPVPEGAFVAVRNPIYFRGPENGAEEVAIMGHFPEIVAAYKALDVPVHVVPDGERDEVDVDPAQMGLPALRKYLKGLGIDFDPKATKDELLALALVSE
ncbi:Ish1 domain-containing protein [Alcaligenes sp. SDU_A2]|uniref:Ish1 domain-containing protein n=1 Tax=Alcaligenes sp. SDU_A2 TaxID=3136634 RepID=UPI00311DFAFE